MARPSARDPAREPRFVIAETDAVDVFVGERRLLGEPRVGGTADDDPLVLQLAPELAACYLAFGSVPAQRAAGAMAGAPPRAGLGSGLSGQHPRGGSHASRDEDRLTHPLIGGRRFGM